MADSLRLVRGAWPSRCGRNLTRPTLGAPRRALFPVSDGEHCLKVRSDEGPERTKLRSQAATGPCSSTHRRRRGEHPPQSCAVRRARETNSLRSFHAAFFHSLHSSSYDGRSSYVVTTGGGEAMPSARRVRPTMIAQTNKTAA